MKTMVCAVAGSLIASFAQAQTFTTSNTFYGNLEVVGSGSCSVVPKGPYPTNATVTSETLPFEAPITTAFTVSILLQGPATATHAALPLQYITDVFNAQGSTYVAYDPQLFGVTGGISGTYSGTIGASGAGLVFTKVVTSSEGCVLTFNGTLY
jgi:hypothetical protein